MTDASRLRQVEEFLAEHGRVIINALDVYARNMNEESGNALAGYNAVQHDPYARDQQDQSYITTNGLLQASRLLKESADKATEARKALEALEEDHEDR